MEKSPSGKLAIILGAGASHDCADLRTAAQVNGTYRPPLTKDIFSATFDDILGRHPRVQKRLDELRTKLRNGGNFEEIFRELLDSAERNNNYWILQIPLYLRELFWTVSRVHLQGSSKFDTLVRGVLESPFEKVLFLNLNYDLLLDDALTNYDLHEFAALTSYSPPTKKWLYVKPHGSVNWARIIKNCPETSPGWYHPARLNEMPIFASELTLVMWNTHSRDFYIPGGGPPGYLYPQIVVPTDRTKKFVCPQDHTDRALAFLQECSTILLVGFSGRDDDIAKLLLRVPVGSHFVIVSKGDGRAVFERIKARAADFEARKPALSFHDKGFSTFLESKTFARLLTGEIKAGPSSRSRRTSPHARPKGEKKGKK
jgi:hypothetical protein